MSARRFSGTDAPISASTTKGSRGDVTKCDGTGSASNLLKQAIAVVHRGSPSRQSIAAAVVAIPEAPTNSIFFENTYKLKPDRKFSVEPARGSAKCATNSADYAQEGESLEYTCSKIIVDMTICEFGQGIRVASRCL
ncbi:hypothetical protein BC830DRAFT_1077823 [Chytriomyces sp. MP71]|nr:hypothetical protein BC830DRAFT_1077823 [Chytriomyces sp. MP71]